jgi:hypothetical protein
MKKPFAMLLLAGASFSATAFTYDVNPPVDESQCPAGAWTGLPQYQPWDPALNCYYTVLGAFTDNYVFEVPNEGVYAFEVTGSSLHSYVASGRAHPTYTTSDVITDVVLTDADGNAVLQLTDTPYWAHPHCTSNFQSGCSPHMTDDWQGSADLPPGQYNLVIMGTVSGNRPGVYGVSIQPPPPPPVQLPLAPLALAGDVSCDLAASVCTLTPADASAVASISLDFANNVATLVPAIDPPYGGPLTYDLVAISDDQTVFSFAGQAVVTSQDGTATVTIVFSMDEVIDPVTGAAALTNWQIGTQ